MISLELLWPGIFRVFLLVYLGPSIFLIEADCSPNEGYNLFLLADYSRSEVHNLFLFLGFE